MPKVYNKFNKAPLLKMNVAENIQRLFVLILLRPGSVFPGSLETVPLVVMNLPLFKVEN